MNAENEKHAFENSKDILAFISGFFCDLIQSNQIKTEQLIDLSEYLYKERQSFSDTLARERAEKFDDVKKEITRLQEKYDENGYDFSPLIKLLRIESIIDSVINTYANKLDTFLSDKTKEEEK